MIDYFKQSLRYFAACASKLADSSYRRIPHIIDKIAITQEYGGNIIFTGVGKSGHVAKKVSATFASLGLRAFFIDPTSLSHGDMGALDKSDLLIVFSKSGNTVELTEVLEQMESVIGITMNPNPSLLNSTTSNVIILPSVDEDAFLKVPPMASTQMMMMVGDALAVAYTERVGFDLAAFARSHPSGDLGQRLRNKAENIA